MLFMARGVTIWEIILGSGGSLSSLSSLSIVAKI